MKTADDYRAERDKLDAKLAEISDLIAALDIIAWQVAQASAEGEMAQLRDAVVGISYALSREIEGEAA